MQTSVKSIIEETIPTQKEYEEVSKKIKFAVEDPKLIEQSKRTFIRHAEIQMIRKMVKDNKKPSQVAKALNITLHSAMYIVKKIKNGEKLKYEN